MQRAQHGDRGDGRASKLRRNVLRNAGQAQNVDVQHLTISLHRFKVLAAVISYGLPP